MTYWHFESKVSWGLTNRAGLCRFESLVNVNSSYGTQFHHFRFVAAHHSHTSSIRKGGLRWCINHTYPLVSMTLCFRSKADIFCNCVCEFWSMTFITDRRSTVFNKLNTRGEKNPHHLANLFMKGLANMRIVLLSSQIAIWIWSNPNSKKPTIFTQKKDHWNNLPLATHIKHIICSLSDLLYTPARLIKHH